MQMTHKVGLDDQDSTSNVRGRAFITATGGTITTCGDFKIHTFTGPGTFCVSQASSIAAENTVGYLVVAGGASGAELVEVTLQVVEVVEVVIEKVKAYNYR